MTFHSSDLILVVARPDGLLISVDGVTHLKKMETWQFVNMAADCLRAANEMRLEQGRLNAKVPPKGSV